MHCCIPLPTTDSNTSTGMIWVTLNMLSVVEECHEPSEKCQGILHCLESGHPVIEVSRMVLRALCVMLLMMLMPTLNTFSARDVFTVPKYVTIQTSSLLTRPMYIAYSVHCRPHRNTFAGPCFVLSPLHNLIRLVLNVLSS